MSERRGSEELRRQLPSALRVYVLTDRHLSRGRGEVDIVRSAIAGGATAIQLRWKDGPLHEAVRTGRDLKALCAAAGVLLFVNDRVDLALVLEADGVHLGDQDLPVGEARQLVGDTMLIGYSPASLLEAVQAERLGADYLGVGPVYATSTKQDAGVPVGTKRIEEVARSVTIPIVGIGGISAENAGAVVRAGAAGVAVISAVVSAADPRAATRQLSSAVAAALDERA